MCPICSELLWLLERLVGGEEGLHKVLIGAEPVRRWWRS